MPYLPPILDLNGTWSLHDTNGEHQLSAQVPGCVHQDLIHAGLLPDLWWRDNEAQHQWPWRRGWAFKREFEASAELLACQRVLLSAEGLDTLAAVSINGQEVLRADNMFRHWLVDVRSVLRPGRNQIEICFQGEAALCEAKQAAFALPAWNLYDPAFAGKSYLRKMACAFGWDWGPMAPTLGIWRSISLIPVAQARLAGVRCKQQHREDNCSISINPEIDGEGRGLRCRINWQAPESGTSKQLTINAGIGSVITIDQPQLWWPNGMGAQPLYRVTVELIDDQNRVLDRWQRRIGLRQLELERIADEHGESFRFVVNGRRVFAKGANWIPCDVFIPRISDDSYRHLLNSAAESHMNMIRVWGGGIYEQDIFYDCCDELGILVWQDFMFACSTYPSFDPDFMENVRAEAVDNVRRLRHHPCLALWCGNNEIEQGLVSDAGWNERSMSWDDYRPLFDELLAEVVAAENPATPYWPCSPHSPHGNRADFNNPSCGDAHAWSVWFGGQSFEAQRQWDFRFMSEFGFQSFPEPRSVAAFTEAEDRNLTSWIMDFHQRSGPGNQTIFKYLLDWFRMPTGFENTLWMTQLTQALCIQYAAEHARRIQGQMDGLLYWQLNDLWPAATWSSIDVFGRWKALQFLAKRFFAPVLVSCLEDRGDSTMALHLSNHLPEDFSGTLHWQLMDAAGKLLRQGETALTVPSQSNRCALVLDCSPERQRDGAYLQPLELRKNPQAPTSSDRDLLCLAWACDQQGEECSRNLGLFARPKHLLLRPPEITAQASLTDDTATLTLNCRHPAPWTRLELATLPGRFSDNFCHCLPNLPQRLQIQGLPPGTSAEQLLSDLRITPLIANA